MFGNNQTLSRILSSVDPLSLPCFDCNGMGRVGGVECTSCDGAGMGLSIEDPLLEMLEFTDSYLEVNPRAPVPEEEVLLDEAA